MSTEQADESGSAAISCAAASKRTPASGCATLATRRANGVALDDALIALAEVDPRKSQVIEMRFFGGLSVEETAEALHVSPETVMRDSRLAKAWLLRELKAPPDNA